MLLKQGLSASALVLLVAASSVWASPEYCGRVPNGTVHRCATCHEKKGPPDLNKFGESFFSAGEKWTPALAAEDSDKDGFTNGGELGDPDGIWKVGDPPILALTRVSLPGDQQSRPTRMTRLQALVAPVTTWIGHYHPVFVHLPIGGLLLVGFLEIVGLLTRFRGVTHYRSLLLGLTLAGTLPAVVCGWFLAQSGNFDPALLRSHELTGFGILIACLLTFALSLTPRKYSYQFSLWGTMLVLFIASHFGGSLTHGPEFLSLKLPAKASRAARLTTAAAHGPRTEVSAPLADSGSP